mmetsp:Transcript_4427/g.17769  ORF Transcript_4427/g.17769 Transcript_4427/m.17769 type:complete len:318 (+) Transcript_4427:366-1319(+)
MAESNDISTARMRPLCSVSDAATMPRSQLSINRPSEKSSFLPPASEHLPPASSTTITPAAWSHTFSLYVDLGNFMKMSASPRARAPYFTCEYSRSGFWRTPMRSAMVALRPWFETPLRTGSQKVAFSGSRLVMLTGTGAMRCATTSESPTGSTVHPQPRCARNMHPLSHSESSGGGNSRLSRRWYRCAYARNSVRVGRFGQPSAPTTSSPSSIIASATAYWSPCTKPYVPSTGSSIQWRPFLPPSEPPASMASHTCWGVRVTPPMCSSGPTRALGEFNASFTVVTTAASVSGWLARSAESSSPMRLSLVSGNASCRM